MYTIHNIQWHMTCHNVFDVIPNEDIKSICKLNNVAMCNISRSHRRNTHSQQSAEPIYFELASVDQFPKLRFKSFWLTPRSNAYTILYRCVYVCVCVTWVFSSKYILETILTTNRIDWVWYTKLYDALLDIDLIKANYQTFNMTKS